MTTRQRTDPRPSLIGQAARDEALDDAAGIHDTEGRVLRADERPDLIDDDLEHLVDGQDTGDGSRGGINRTKEVRSVARSVDTSRPNIAHRSERSIR